MGDENKTGTQNPSKNTEQKPGLFARASAWQTNNPNKSTALVAGATFGAIKAAEFGVRKVRDHFAEEAVEPAKEQAAALVGGLARGFSKRFG